MVSRSFPFRRRDQGWGDDSPFCCPVRYSGNATAKHAFCVRFPTETYDLTECVSRLPKSVHCASKICGLTPAKIHAPFIQIGGEIITPNRSNRYAKKPMLHFFSCSRNRASSSFVTIRSVKGHLRDTPWLSWHSSVIPGPSQLVAEYDVGGTGTRPNTAAFSKAFMAFLLGWS
jgi:hypothetical protein